jgi:TonB family protein
LPQAIEEYVASLADQKPTLTAKLEKIESLSSIDDAQFTPPADAVPPPKVITLDVRETSRRLLHHPYPEYDFMYPGEHRSAHSVGFVIIALRIHTDGHVSNLRVVGGTQEMRQASLDAVRNWTYKPFTLDGEPVEVNTTAFLDYPLTR